jgi:hypothetical protein
MKKYVVDAAVVIFALFLLLFCLLHPEVKRMPF